MTALLDCPLLTDGRTEASKNLNYLKLPHTKIKKLLVKTASPSLISALKCLLRDWASSMMTSWTPYYLPLGEECPWMWPKFLECNNKYLKCLATVRLINKLFTPQYIEEKTLSGLTWHLASINLGVIQANSVRKPCCQYTRAQPKLWGLFWIRWPKWSHGVLEKNKNPQAPGLPPKE